MTLFLIVLFPCPQLNFVDASHNSKGTSALILETQTAGFRALLPEYYEYRFFDGEEPFESYPEISNIFPGPYFCYYKDNSMKSVKLAHEYVNEIIEDEGNTSLGLCLIRSSR